MARADQKTGESDAGVLEAEVGVDAVLGLDLSAMPGHLLRRCHQRSREVYERHLGATGLSREQVALMIAMYQNPNVAHARLSELTGFDRNTLADMVDRLMVKKLTLRRRARDDKRAYEVALTAKGARALTAMVADIDATQAEILSAIPQELRVVFVRCLRVMAGFEGAADDARSERGGERGS